MTTVETGVAAGVSFALTAEQRELRALAREFAEKEIRPKAAEYDEHSTHPVDLIAKAHELGLMNVHVPESLGGPALPAFDAMLVGEELNWGCSGMATSIGANRLGAAPVLIAGTEEQQRTWLAPLLEEPMLCSFATLGAGRRLGRGAHQDDGRAAWRRVRHQRLEDVHHERRPCLVDRRLRVDGSAAGSQGHLGLRRPDGRAGRARSRSTWTRWASARRTRPPSPSPTSSFRSRTASAEEDEGFKIAMKTLDFTRPGTAVGAVGVAQAAYELRGRVREGARDVRRPIAMHQGINFLIADMATEIEASRLLDVAVRLDARPGLRRKATL